MKFLIVVDMQKDFISGSLANDAAQEIVEPMAQYIKSFAGPIIFTQDTHQNNYLETYEDPQLTIRKHYIEIDGPEFAQIDKLNEREGIELLFPIYHDGHILKYIFNTWDEKERNCVIVEDGRAFYCNDKGEEVEYGYPI